MSRFVLVSARDDTAVCLCEWSYVIAEADGRRRLRLYVDVEHCPIHREGAS